MNPPPPPDDANHDPLGAYADGDPDAVRAARPREPSEAEWEAVRRRVHARLSTAPREPESAPRRRAGLWFAVAATLTAAAAAVAWVVLAKPRAAEARKPPDVAETKPAPPAVDGCSAPPRTTAGSACGVRGTADRRFGRGGALPRPRHGGSGQGRSCCRALLELATADDLNWTNQSRRGRAWSPAPGCGSDDLHRNKPR